MKKGNLSILLSVVFVFSLVMSGLTYAQINVITVDINPFTPPGFGSAPFTTMGMALQNVDQGSDFNVTEVTPAAFVAMTAAQLSAYDLIAINNHPVQIGPGIGTTWHSVVNGRIMLNSHDAARFKMNFTDPPLIPFSMMPYPGGGVAPFGADELVRQAAIWAGGIPGRTGLLIFNDSARFFTVPGVGWDNAELNLPAVWGITDSDQTGGGLPGGGYTSIVAPGLPVYSGAGIPGGVTLSDVRFDVNSISSFAANIVDTSFHSVFGSYNPAIFTPTEVVINAGVLDPAPGGAFIGDFDTVPGPDGLAITLVHEPELGIDVGIDIKPETLNLKSKGEFTAFIELPEGYDEEDIDVDTVECEGAPALMGHVADDGKFIVKFDREDLVGVPIGDNVELTVTGKLTDGTMFVGSDTIRVIGPGKPAPGSHSLTTTWGNIKSR